MSNRFLVALALTSTVLCTPRVQAQNLAFRIGAGPALTAEEFGAVGMIAGELSRQRVMLRISGDAVTLGRSANATGTARLIALDLGAGVTGFRTIAGLNTYALARIGAGIDPREGDDTTIFGASLGLESTRRVGFFGEVRYDYWRQHGVMHNDLPANVFSAVVGVVLH